MSTQQLATINNQNSNHNTSQLDVTMTPIQSTTTISKNRKLNFTQLPDELISKCYSDLSASDLVALEHVSRRLRHLISYDSLCWKRCTEDRWSHLSSNTALLSTAVRHAGSWKNLFSEKANCDSLNKGWHTLCKSESSAIIDIIKGYQSTQSASSSSSKSCWSMNQEQNTVVPSSPPKDISSGLTSSSPCSVMPNTPPVSVLSVIVLIDASSSVTEEDFQSMKKFARSLVDNLRQNQSDSAVAVIQFNQHPKVEIPLTTVDKVKLVSSIESIGQLMGSTDIAAPIRRAREILANEASPGDRAIVLLTDGQTSADELQQSEKEARKSAEEVGARLYTLGVGRDINECGLGRIAAGTEGGMYFTLRRQASSK